MWSTEPPGAATSLPADLSPARNLRVLCVDDDRRHATLVRRWLALAGMTKVDVCHDLSSALRALGHASYDVALVDFRLNVYDGLTLLDAMRTHYRHLPVVVVSGSASRRVDLVVMQAGAAAFLDKHQLSAGRLARAVRHIVQQAHHRSSFA